MQHPCGCGMAQNPGSRKNGPHSGASGRSHDHIAHCPGRYTLPYRRPDAKKDLAFEGLWASASDVGRDRPADQACEGKLIVSTRFGARNSQYAFTPVNIVEVKSRDLPRAESQVRQTSCNGIVATASDGLAIEDRKEAAHIAICQGPGQRCQLPTGRSRHSKSERFLTVSVKPTKAKVAAERRSKNLGACRHEAGCTFRQVSDHIFWSQPGHIHGPVTEELLEEFAYVSPSIRAGCLLQSRGRT